MAARSTEDSLRPMLAINAICLTKSLRWVAIGLLVTALFITPRSSWSSSQDLFGMGARPTAMAGAVVSNGEGFASVYYNPAALMLTEEMTFTLGYQRADFGLDLNDQSYDVDAASNLLIGFNIPIPFGGFLEDRLAIGLGFVMPTLSVVRARVPQPETPYFVVVEHRPQVVGIHAGLSIRFFDWLYAGFSVVALAELVGGITVAPNDTGNLGTEVRDELVADYAPIAGLLVQPMGWMSFGFAYHAQSDSRFTFPISADLGEGFPLDVPLLDVQGVAQYDPLQLSGEVTVWPLPQLQIAAGVSWKRWSTFETPIINTTPAAPTQDLPGFSDIWVPRLGSEYSLLTGEMSWAFRLGGFYEPSPVPEQVANNNFLDSARVGVGGGVGWAWRELTVDLAFQMQLMLDRSHDKDEEAVRDPENAGLPSIEHGGNIFVSVFELGLAF